MKVIAVSLAFKTIDPVTGPVVWPTRVSIGGPSVPVS